MIDDFLENMARLLGVTATQQEYGAKAVLSLLGQLYAEKLSLGISSIQSGLIIV